MVNIIGMDISLFIAGSAYALAFSALFINAQRGGQMPVAMRHCLMGSLLVAVLAEMAALLLRWSGGEKVGINVGIVDAFAVISVLVIAVVCIGAWRHHDENNGLLTIPFAWVSLLLLLLFPLTEPAAIGSGVGLHIFSALGGYALATVAAVQALLLRHKQRGLKKQAALPVFNWLPPLEVIERGMFRSVYVAIALLTVALVTGLMVVDGWEARGLIHKSLLTLVAWLLFCALALGRWRFGWRGNKAVRAVLAAYLLLLLAYFGSQLVILLIDF